MLVSKANSNGHVHSDGPKKDLFLVRVKVKSLTSSLVLPSLPLLPSWVLAFVASLES